MILLSSYPKSGNTWLRFIVYHLCHGRMPADSRELDRFINSKAPEQGGAGYKKSHAAFDWIGAHVPGAERAVYVVRHPLDVMQSALNYAILTGEMPEDADRTAWSAAWIAAYIENAGHPLWRGAPYNAGTWMSNVGSWRSQTRMPLLWLGYERLAAGPEAAVAEIARFLGLAATPDAIARCCADTRFEGLKAFEEDELRRAAELSRPAGRFSGPERQRMARSGIRFFNTGKPGAFASAIPPDLQQRAWDRFGAMAEDLGYHFG